MVKADPKRDYYADLDVPPDADADEIRKQFRKLALKWHPDRNPGREADCVPKFQAIQAAQEILVDPEQRRQYDAARRKGAGFYTTASRPNVPTRGNPYQATSNFPPPPRRTQRPQPQQTRSEYKSSTASHGASRFSQFPKPPPTSQKPGFQDTPEAKANVFNAWQNMNHNTKPKVPPRNREDTSARGKTAWEGVNKPQQQTGPGVGRSSSTRTPRRGGFDPAVPGADEPPARGTSGYNSTRYSYRPVPNPQAYTDIPEKSTSANIDPLNQSKPQATPEAETPYAEGSPRSRAPYNSTGGERIFINPLGRAASTKASPQQPGSGSARSPRSGQFGSTQRQSSASPPRRGGNATRPFAMYSSSDDDDVAEIPNRNRRAERASEPEPPRPQAQNPSDVNGNPQPSASVPNPAYTNGGTGQKSQPTMYGKQFPTSHGSFSRYQSLFQSFDKKEETRQAEKPKIPYWAYPSTVMPPLANSSSSPASEGDGKRAASGAHFGIPNPLRQRGNTLADPSTPHFSFTMPINHDTFASNRHEQTRTRSTDSINTDFVSPDWHGKFEGKTDYFPPFGGTRARPKDGTRNRSSPIRGKATGTTRLNTGTNAFSDYVIPPQQVPPPPPFPPPQQQKSSSSVEESVPPSAPNTFSPDHWGNVFTTPDAFAPIPPQKPPSPAKAAPPARRAKPPSRTASAANSRPGGMKPKPATVSDDVPNGDTVDSAASSSTLDSSAMDIDSVPTEPKTRPARKVPVPVSQKTWDKFKQQATMPAKSNSQPLQGTDGADAIRMNDFQNVAPFTSTSEAGLKDLNDLGSTLPFESGTSTAPPVRSESPPPLDLPTPPRAPVQPPRLNKASWDEYRRRAALYMKEWCRFDSRMLQHIAARQQATEELGAALDWLSAYGDSSTRGGFGSYMQGQREDQKVRAHWNTATEQHLKAMGDFEEYRNKVLSLKGGLPAI